MRNTSEPKNQLSRREFLVSLGALGATTSITSGLYDVVAKNNLPQRQIERMTEILFSDQPARQSITLSENTDFITKKGGGQSNLKASPIQALPYAAPGFVSWFGTFMTQVGIGVASTVISNWISDKTKSERKKINNANNMMVNAGYTDISLSDVYEDRGSAGYGIMHHDGVNMCAAIYPKYFNRIYSPIILEAPTISGLYIASNNWYDRDVSSRKGALPTSYSSGANPLVHQTNFNSPMFFETDVGWIGTAYEPKTNNSGRVVVASADTRKRREEILFRGDYNITF